MSLIQPRDLTYSKAPFYNNNRKENFLIEVEGTIIPDADTIFYGLLNSGISEEFPVIRDVGIITPKDLYYNIAYYSKNDMLKYLKGLSKDDVWGDFSSVSLDDAYSTAVANYWYIPFNETMIFHAIVEAAMYDFVQSITFLFNRPITEIDLAFFDRVLPDKVREKVTMASGTILEAVIDNGNKSKSEFEYSTIITNSIEAIHTMINEKTKYNITNTLFMLRNHSGNMEVVKTKNSDGKEISKFEEIGTIDILKKITDKQTGLPNSSIRFGRFEPLLYNPEKQDEDFYEKF